MIVKHRVFKWVLCGILELRVGIKLQWVRLLLKPLPFLSRSTTKKLKVYTQVKIRRVSVSFRTTTIKQFVIAAHGEMVQN